MLNYDSPRWASAMSRTPTRDHWALPPMGQEDCTSTEESTVASSMSGKREDLPAGFATPLRVTVMGSTLHRGLLEFRTPQNPCMGSNNWGGASPLLARNIPMESLDTKYLRLNTLRTRDEIFPMADQVVDLQYYQPPAAAPSWRESRDVGRGSWLLSKLRWKRKKAAEVICLGGERKKKSGWRLSRRDYRTRWPQGWC